MTDPPDDPELETLLEFLRSVRSLDFTGYKRPSLTRRIRKRMQEVGVVEFEDYRDVLEADSDEQSRLLDTILINVTGFFRDPDAWAQVADEIVPAIIDSKAPDEPIRVWSAGCSSGEEAYTLAMILADALGIDQFKARVKIFATDTDEGALAIGRTAIYTERQLEAVPDDKRDRYFAPVPTGFAFRPDCRRSVIFGRHDITADAPISRVDLLVCRNVLMYFVAETQRRALGRFHYALADGGYLFLGKAETIFSHSDLFTAVDTPRRIYRRIPLSSPRREWGIDPLPVAEDLLGRQAPLATSTRVLELAAAATPVAQLVIDIDGRLVGANTRARAFFGITRDDLERPFTNLEVSYRPVELRAHIDQAYAQAQPVVIRDVERPLADGQHQFLEVTVAPLRDPAGIDLGVAVTFADVTELGRTKVELERSSNELRRAYDDLAEANVRLETSNEELQSTNEELETTNEELQSANEELETMNEELQSANEELGTMNEELLTQAGEIEAGERFLAAILDSLTTGVAVLTESFDVVVWNRTAEDLFGLRAEEVRGRSFFALDLALPIGEIGPMLHRLTGSEPGDDQPVTSSHDIVDGMGRPLHCSVTVGRLVEPRPAEPIGAGHHFIILVEPGPGAPR